MKKFSRQQIAKKIRANKKYRIALNYRLYDGSTKTIYATQKELKVFESVKPRDKLFVKNLIHFWNEERFILSNLGLSKMY
jgi:NAD dependent epimerase/dehydratase family enzyme